MIDMEEVLKLYSLATLIFSWVLILLSCFDAILQYFDYTSIKETDLWPTLFINSCKISALLSTRHRSLFNNTSLFLALNLSSDQASKLSILHVFLLMCLIACTVKYLIADETLNILCSAGGEFPIKRYSKIFDPHCWTTAKIVIYYYLIISAGNIC